MSNITYKETFKVRASEIDFEQKATLPAICNLLQEVAGNHARELEFDITDLQKNELTWVLHRLTVEIDRFPKWRETITIKTWPSSGDGLRAHRDFLILDRNQEVIGKSLSYWLILNIKNRRPVRIPKEIMQMAPNDTQHVLPVTEVDFPEIESPKYKHKYEVRKTDLDLNKHVNNVHYVDWALATLPEETNVRKVDISFLGEAVLGDTVGAQFQEYKNDTDYTFYHQLRRPSDNNILAQAVSG
ncbi:acyl-[acyl-carrier-protein] thioesterase [Fodinibius sp. Rm-B-1B1-1]|uniref:acyl-[acyl-carrier-protein] thioesterase n=1 Tax=Fodinibius alkaliphilus TaxID=3140241 RepID=UPI00315A1A02